MEGLSKKEIEIVAWLEFEKRYFFTAKDIEKFTKNKTQRYNIVKNLLRKERIIKLNRSKYYLVPIKAKSGKWVEYPFIVANEMMNGKDYFINGWAAANYWRLTDQIPFQTDVYTTRRQGKVKLFNDRIVFHRTTKKRIRDVSVTKSIRGHQIRIMSEQESKKWIKRRE